MKALLWDVHYTKFDIWLEESNTYMSIKPDKYQYDGVRKPSRIGVIFTTYIYPHELLNNDVHT